MKKTYMIPTTIVVKLRLTKMVAASEFLYFSNEEVSTASGAESRRRGNSVWDDDDDDFDY